MATVLVTGGAGYIGSHVVLKLGELGYKVIVLDNLCSGFREAVQYGELIVGDVGDQKLLNSILNEYDIKAVMHFAAHTKVGESVAEPIKYYSNNTCKTLKLLECCNKSKIKHFVFSSTASVYGITNETALNEDSPTQPINPYGHSKLMAEQMVKDQATANGMRYAILRYFNVAGSSAGGKIGQSTPDSTLLIKVACEVATGKREYVPLFGTDYATADGTAIRDYIHVDDIAEAHIELLKYLTTGGESTTLNCGYGHGYSVREVLDRLEKVLGKPLNIQQQDRRPGDPPALIADVSRIKEQLGWRPRYDDLDYIVSTSLEWERKRTY